MLKKTVLLLGALLIPTLGLAEVYEGTTQAAASVVVTAESPGLLNEVHVMAGDRVDEGQVLFSLAGERTFSAVDGIVSLIRGDVGDDLTGTALELIPAQLYRIHCTIDGALQVSANTLIHSGETVYVKCTADGTHRAIGVVTQVEGGEYQVLTLGGELYLGETVYLYRDDSFSPGQRIGIGTVVSNDPVTCEASGKLTALYVDEGDMVERGQLLYEIGGGTIAAPVAGIVKAVEAPQGSRVQANQIVAEIVPEDGVCIEIRVSEVDISSFDIGQSVGLIPAGLDEDDALEGTVTALAWVAEDECYTVTIAPPPGAQLPLGMSVTVRTA